MAREIIVDVDTCVGYAYPQKSYYVTNKGTTTYRRSVADIKQVLDTVAPNNTITREDIEELYLKFEAIKSLSYTLADNGSYIQTIQINNYDKNPLTIDFLANKLYIMNTNLIFDLTLNEDKKYRIDYLVSYFKDQLGVEITNSHLGSIYDKLVEYYNPTCYNEVAPRTDDEKKQKAPIKYSNKFALTNHNGKSKAVYYCTEKTQEETRGYITNISKTNKQITLTNQPTYKVGDTILVENTEVADGHYMVTNVNNNIITIEQEPKADYTFPYKEVYLRSAVTYISNINRDTRVITLTSTVPQTLQVGNKIEITGATVPQQADVISADGTYTIQAISGSTITVQEQPRTSYTGTMATMYKKVSLGNMLSCIAEEVTLSQSVSVAINSAIEVYNKGKLEGVYTCSNQSGNKITLTNCPDYTPKYPLAKGTIVEIEVMDSHLDKLPDGVFIVDNFPQCQQYISMGEGVVVPTSEHYESINAEVPTTMSMPSPLPPMTLKGLYSEVYKQK